MKQTVAVFFGGLSSEHDVSVCTGLEVLQALDPERYDTLPVYIGLDGQWWVGDVLRDIAVYIPDLATKRQLVRVCFPVGGARQQGRFVLQEVGGSRWRAPRTFAFDVALPALHGTWGEDGTLQGVLAAEGVPMACGGVGAMGIAINKMSTMHAAAVRDIPVLPSLLVHRGEAEEAVETAVGVLGDFPLFVKPNFLGSSMGVHKVATCDALTDALTDALRLDTAVVIQPCVPNLVEYNVAVRRKPDGTVVTSAIERPLRKGELLSFADKYAGSGTNKLGRKINPRTAGMAHMDRVLNPPELGARETQIRAWAVMLFNGLEMSGAPRLDFLCDEVTGEIWFNEMNPIPGGLASFLWEVAPEPVGFTDLLTGMIEDAVTRARTQARLVDPLNTGGALFTKRG